MIGIDKNVTCLQKQIHKLDHKTLTKVKKNHKLSFFNGNPGE